MILHNELPWRLWALTAALLIVGVSGYPAGFYLAAALSLFQVILFARRERSLTAFPVQVRIAYFAILVLCLWPPLTVLMWIPTAGTLALVLFGYCTLARMLSLFPWNRREPITWALIWRTFTMPPKRGNVLQGLPATTTRAG